MTRLRTIASLSMCLALLAPVWNAATVRAQPAQEGAWEESAGWPLAASHAALLPDGRVLAWDDFGTAPTIWDPVTDTFSPAQHPDLLLPGTATVQLGSGDLAFVGGRTGLQLGSSLVWRFRPATLTWTLWPLLNMERDRSTAILLGDGRILVVGGDRTPGQPADLPETAEPGGLWKLIQAASLVLPRNPWTFWRANGRVVVAGPDANTRELNESTQMWSVVDDMVLGGRTAGSAVLLPGPAERVLIAGGRDPATATCEVIDLEGDRLWAVTGSMAQARRHHDLTLLADGTVLATGGTLTGDDSTFSVLSCEKHDPLTGLWTTWASMSVPRRAHSVSLLLPDGRVLVAGGGDGTAGSELHPDASIFSPPYLFQGPRPQITAAPDSIRYKGVYTLDTPEATDIVTVWLVRAGAVAQGFNSGQRALPLPFAAVPGQLTVSAPDTSGVAPPGTWMLFLVDDAGVPSEAAMVRMVDGPAVVPLPSIAPSAPPTAEVGVHYVYAAQASGGTPITWSLTQAPAWMQVNAQSGIVTGVPEQQGMVDVVLRATNVEGYDEEAWQLQVDPSTQPPVTVVAVGDTWRYFKGLSDPGADWAQPLYDDAAWLQGPSGFGFGDLDDATVLDDMQGNYTTVYTRIGFAVVSATTVSRLSFLFDYDDGFAVWLNGTRIISRRAPDPITPTSTATSAHEAPGSFERQDLTDPAVLGLLQSGANVLAVVGLNRSLFSNDLTLRIAVEITGGDPPVDAHDGLGSSLAVRVRPNPFRGGTGVSFALPRPGTTRLEVFDVRGRRVHVQQHELLAGPHQLAWDGRDPHGRPAPAGIYPYRLLGPGIDVRGKMTRLSPLR